MKPAALFRLAAGAGDAATGLLLVAAPDLVLRLLGIPGEGSIFLRFVGVFVGCVGLAYLYPFLAPSLLTARTGRVAAVMEVTGGMRLAVALFLLAAVLRGAMPAPWLIVAGFDAAVAVAQLALLRRGCFEEA